MGIRMPAFAVLALFFALAAAFTPAAHARGRMDAAEPPNAVSGEDAVSFPEITGLAGTDLAFRGTVRIFGNEPHTFAGLRTEDGSATYAVWPPEREAALRRFQGRLLEFTGILLERPAGPGDPYLRDGTVCPLSWKVIR